jgi:hypothetical protein
MVEAAPQETDDPDGLPPRPVIDEDPATVDAHRTFLATLLGAAIFIAVVVSFIL